MQPYKYYQRFVAAIVQRSGLSRPTVEAVLPHVFDEIRYQLTEGSLCVPIESFGTFHVKDVPEHEYLYNRNNANRICIVPAKRQIKFVPTRNLRTEMEQGRYDPTRKSFVHHPKDPRISKRNDLRYRPENYDRAKGVYSRSIYKKRTTDSTDRTD